jgi:ubiquinol-cytochrome c reductase cytochrome c subunit
VTSSTARRRHRLAGLAVVLFGLLVVGAAYAVITGTASPASAAAPNAAQQAQIAEGRTIFQQNCATCHGFAAQGQQDVAPSLIGVGAAAVDFQVSTGRMPAKENGPENDRKPLDAVFALPNGNPNEKKIHALAAYIQSLGGGPLIPSRGQVNPAGANLALGQSLFIANCAQCHNFSGAGGALTYGKFAPSLVPSTPTQIYEAMLTGPEAMPVFNDSTITPNEKRDIIGYVTSERSVSNPGGFSLGRVGPVTEGLVVFLGVLLFMVLAAMWITAKQEAGKGHE